MTMTTTTKWWFKMSIEIWWWVQALLSVNLNCSCGFSGSITQFIHFWMHKFNEIGSAKSGWVGNKTRFERRYFSLAKLDGIKQRPFSVVFCGRLLVLLSNRVWLCLPIEHESLQNNPTLVDDRLIDRVHDFHSIIPIPVTNLTAPIIIDDFIQ